MTAGIYTIEVDAGANALIPLKLADSAKQPINVATYAANFSVWPTLGNTATPLLSLTNGGGITLGNAATNLGDINITLTAAQTAQVNIANSGGEAVNINGKPGRACAYTLVLNNAGFKTRILQGPFVVYGPNAA